MGDVTEAYISREVLNVFKDYRLVAVNEVLPGGITSDFHFKDQDGNDLFVEVYSGKLGRTKLGRILDIYAAISNLEPPLSGFELVVIAPGVASSVRRKVRDLPVRLLTHDQIGISYEKSQERGEEQRQKMRSLSPREAELVARWESEKKRIVRATDIQEALGCKPDYAYYLIHELERKGFLERISDGLYQFIPLSYGYEERTPPRTPSSWVQVSWSHTTSATPHPTPTTGSPLRYPPPTS